MQTQSGGWAQEQANNDTVANTESTDFEFSVVIAVHNTSEYLPEAIDSIIEQTVGISCIQVVLVDDGSTDSSCAICRDYVHRYPDNIELVELSHSGAAAARNAGLERVRGTYVNFLDSDDKWSADAFACARAFFETHPDINLAASKYCYFGARKGNHRLNYKFEQEQVVELADTYDFPQLSAASCFFKSSVFARRRFDTRLVVSEDAKLVNSILIDEIRYGVLQRPVYWYRQRSSNDSAINLSKRTLSWYLDTPQLCYRYLLDYSMHVHGRILPFVQYTVMYDLQWRLRAPVSPLLSDAEVEQYRKLLEDLLSSIDDEIMLSVRDIPAEYVAYAQCLKRGIPLEQLVSHLTIRNNMVVYAPDNTGIDAESEACGDESRSMHDVPIRSLEMLSDKLVVDFARFERGKLVLEGYVNSTCIRPNNANLFFVVNDEILQANLQLRPYPSVQTTFDGRFPGRSGFCVSIPVKPEHIVRIEAFLDASGSEMRSLVYKFGRFTGLTPKAPESSYCMSDEGVVRLESKRRLACFAFPRRLRSEKQRAQRRAAYEQRYRLTLEKKRTTAKAIALREAALQHTGKRKIVLFMDFPTQAGGNAEALFRYACAHTPHDMQPVFVLNKEASGFDELEAVGKVVEYGTQAHKKLFARAHAIVSSTCRQALINPLGKLSDYMLDMMPALVYLPDRVITEDESASLHRASKNIALMAVSAQREFDAITQGAYGYDASNLCLAGMARWDKIEAEANRHGSAEAGLVADINGLRISIVPSWSGSVIGIRDERLALYLDLVNDGRLQTLLERTNSSIRLTVPAYYGPRLNRLNTYERIELDASENYYQAMLDADILITDYSGLSFDCAITGKPLLYLQQPDDLQYRKLQQNPTYFSYEKDGFGAVCTNTNALVDELEALIATSALRPQLYDQRAEQFFCRPAKPRCAVLLEAIMRYLRV